MAEYRRKEGDETWARLKEWTGGQKASERLSGHIIRADGFESIDPSHPLGGRDDLKDIISKKNNKNWVCGCFFPRGQQKFSQIKKKFSDDLEGAIKHNSDGFIFVTNQEISVKEREILENQNTDKETEIYHIERITSLLNSPICYGVRLEFLDIGLTKEEQLAYFAERDRSVLNLKGVIEELVHLIESSNKQKTVPVSELMNFKSLLNSIVGDDDFVTFVGNTPIDKLRVPINEIKEFKRLLENIVGQNYDIFSIQSNMFVGETPINKLNVPLNELKEFKNLLDSIVGPENPLFARTGLSTTSTALTTIGSDHPQISKLHVPLHEIQEYEKTLDRIIQKQNHMRVQSLCEEKKEK
ncbi:MAG TPA: hypothetical protein PKZ42_09640 [Syntrophales bacterium]|nr:hypothetical protein [Syntrophales bacterium]